MMVAMIMLALVTLVTMWHCFEECLSPFGEPRWLLVYMLIVLMCGYGCYSCGLAVFK